MQDGKIPYSMPSSARASTCASTLMPSTCSENVKFITTEVENCGASHAQAHWHHWHLCPLWVRSGHSLASILCPLYPKNGHRWAPSTCPPRVKGGHCGTPVFRRSVMTVRNSSRPIARVFRATAAPGCRDELLQRFHSSSAALVNSKMGCLKYRILEPLEASASEVVFESIWRDLDAVKMAFGDAWQQSHLPEGYSALMTAYSVHHFLVSESSTTK
jgi:quinol monooxygenase YgiN